VLIVGWFNDMGENKMGIDVYMRWNGQTKEEKEAQLTGFSIVHGYTGYLREAYHGEPYATRILVPEAFFVEDIRISAKILRERLPKTLEACEERYKNDIYKEQAKQSYIDFVELAERKEKETGQPVLIIVSA
jgi:hypothetical protein